MTKNQCLYNIAVERHDVNVAQTRDYVPRLTKDQVDAVDRLQAIAEGDGSCIELDWAPGTFAFVHGHQMFHLRAPYED